MSDCADVVEPYDQEGDAEGTPKTSSIKRSRAVKRVRKTRAIRKAAASKLRAHDRALTTAVAGEHTDGEGGATGAAPTPPADTEMARKPEAPETHSYYKLIEEDPTVPKSDVVIGPPEEAIPPKPMADLSKPEDFPEDVQAIIASAPK
jgi:hypothetical protein